MTASRCRMFLQRNKWNYAVLSKSYSTASARLASDETRPFSEMPAPSSFKLYWNFFKNERYTNHTNTHNYFEEYGPIFKFQFGKDTIVNVADPESAREMMKHEGQYPQRFQMEPWILHRQGANYPAGLLTSDDELWQRNRSAVNRHMMRPQSVAQLTEHFNKAAQDLVSLLDPQIEKGHGKVEKLRDYLFRWSIESACCIIFEERLGCLNQNPPADIIEFINAIQTMFATTELLVIMPRLARALGLPIWKKHVKAWDTILATGIKYGSKRIEKSRKALESDEETKGLIPSMIQHGDLNDKEMLSNLVDLMTGAVDTTSTAMQWTLYQLAKYPEVQQKLHHQIVRVVPSGEDVTQQHLNNLPYLKAVVKETLRLNPVAPFSGRRLSDDAIIGGYHVPKGVLVNVAVWTLGRNPDVYTDPKIFRPERWLRKDPSAEKHHPYAFMSFGYGARSCIGRRVAELEVYLLLVKIILGYEIIDGSPNVELDAENRILLIPKGEPDIIFKKRA